MSPDGFGTHTDPVRAVRFGRSVLGSVFRAMRKGGRMPALSRMRRTGIGLFAKTSGNRTRRGRTVLSVSHRAPDPFRAGLPARSMSVVNLPFPGPPRRSGQGVLCRMPESDRYSLGGAGDARRTVFPTEKYSLSGLEREAGTGAYRGVSVLLQQIRRPVDLVERHRAYLAVADASHQYEGDRAGLLFLVVLQRGDQAGQFDAGRDG